MFRSITNWASVGLLILLSFACSISDIVNESGTETEALSPDAVRTRDGAIRFYHGVVQLEAAMIADYVRKSGLLTDELRDEVPSQTNVTLNQRTTNMLSVDNIFERINTVRANARQARYVLPTYVGDQAESLLSHLYSIEAMADVLLAELYCSGIPLSTIDHSGDFTLRSGSATAEVFQTAVVLFDSALVMAGDSISFRHLARIGKARALLGLAAYDSAAATVAEVPDEFVFVKSYRAGIGLNNGFSINASVNTYSQVFSMSDREGGNGLAFVSSADPRTDTAISAQPSGNPIRWYIAKKYSDTVGITPIVLASGVEARLIEAEAALHNNDVPKWLHVLNALRTSCPIMSSCPTPAPAGTGGVAGLPVLEDPVTQPLPPGKSNHDVRVDTQFSERAFWLYLTGHRQGDLRRMIRQYNRTQEAVYPSGNYLIVTRAGQSYGSDVTLPVPESERTRNRYYMGCIDREA